MQDSDEDGDEEEAADSAVDMSQRRARRLADMKRRRAARAEARKGPEQGWGGARGKVGSGVGEAGSEDADGEAVPAGSKRKAGSASGPAAGVGEGTEGGPRPSKQSRVSSGKGKKVYEKGITGEKGRARDVVSMMAAAKAAGRAAEGGADLSGGGPQPVAASGSGGKVSVPAGGFLRPDGGLNVSGVKFDRADPLA